ncbi:hypothetical protein [Janthinobacterium fluminis]|uniref:DUF3471 domain-containing protein n=1 Tax=Janthinobacterium fluminis TaxID=2987524 RepID=A0ABT5JYS2_9BURK|nr:hypothetical protein [Janthinobacterium fluminis]MDC8757196.1 hypothetical protein [Janthinobacterium fluminis]
MKKRYLMGVLAGACTLGAAALLLRAPAPAAPAAAPAANDTARPAVFSEGTAMRAIFGAYHTGQKGTLIPVAKTAAWDIKGANVLATPMLAVTFDEGGQQKGVLVIQRQMILDGGEVAESHIQQADISVYVFALKNNAWVFEKGKQVVATAGAHGQAPDGKLVRIGDGKFGLLFEGGDVHQGYTNDYAFLIDISAGTPHQVLALEMGQSNAGNCSDDPKELAEEYGMLRQCWRSVVELDFLKNGPGEYFTIRATDSGTLEEGKPFKKVEYYAMTKDGYKVAGAASLRQGAPLSREDVYGSGGGQRREANMPTAPRRQLN